MKGDGEIYGICLTFLCDDGRNAVAQIEMGCGVDGIDRYKFGDKSNRVWVLQSLKMCMGSFVRSVGIVVQEKEDICVMMEEMQWHKSRWVVGLVGSTDTSLMSTVSNCSTFPWSD